jgi:hypothetical protein
MPTLASGPPQIIYKTVMCNMKIQFFLIIFILPFFLFGQNNLCCKSKHEIRDSISGIWKKIDEESNIEYHISFNEKIGTMMTFESTKIKGTYKQHRWDIPFIRIIRRNGTFKMRVEGRTIQQTSSIIHLGNNKMILETNGDLIEYCKISK